VPVSLVVARRRTHVSGVGLVLLVSRRRDCREGKSEVEIASLTLALTGHGGQRCQRLRLHRSDEVEARQGLQLLESGRGNKEGAALVK